jgi:signal transduction histidine kinase
LIPADYQQITQIINEMNLVLPELSIRSVDKSLQNTIGILVVDRSESLIIETKDDTKYNSYDAAGLGAYSNSKPIALSYASIFDSLWKQTELYEKLSETHEQLKIHTKMQKEFLDIAAHELRTPIEPILGLTGVLRSDKTMDRASEEELLDVILRNAKRLQRLADDIVDTTKIESQSLILNKERLNLNDVISNGIQDIKNQIDYTSSGVKVMNESKADDVIFLEADKYRVTQVVTNLLSNAVKFLKGYDGNVYVNIEKKEDVEGRQEIALVSVSDTGTGIDPEIFPRLFEKFASFKGIGLGLFICRSIVEAHGGRIWAENIGVAGEKGATFYFTLPIANSSRK